MVSLRLYSDNYIYLDKKNCIFVYLKKVRYWFVELIFIGFIIVNFCDC